MDAADLLASDDQVLLVVLDIALELAVHSVVLELVRLQTENRKYR